jgi:hypothetical protein
MKIFILEFFVVVVVVDSSFSKWNNKGYEING